MQVLDTPLPSLLSPPTPPLTPPPLRSLTFHVIHWPNAVADMRAHKRTSSKYIPPLLARGLSFLRKAVTNTKAMTSKGRSPGQRRSFVIAASGRDSSPIVDFAPSLSLRLSLRRVCHTAASLAAPWVAKDLAIASFIVTFYVFIESTNTSSVFIMRMYSIPIAFRVLGL